ncbi:MAG: hypothetical protein P8J88_03665 [Phycisphaerales bacterium]|nr:hypothetical protein [Phycisphaerales bacterium]
MGIRNAMLRLLPASLAASLAASMESESRDWQFECPHCGGRTSVWEIGGLRWKARGRPWRSIHCPACDRRVTARLLRSKDHDELK